MTQMPRCNCMRGLQLHVLPASPFSALPVPPPPTPSHFTSQQHTKCYESYSPCLSPAHCHYTYFKAQYSMHLKIMSCSLFVCLCLYVYAFVCVPGGPKKKNVTQETRSKSTRNKDNDLKISDSIAE